MTEARPNGWVPAQCAKPTRPEARNARQLLETRARSLEHNHPGAAGLLPKASMRR